MVEKTRKRVRGITLIALVITIIVLLILAGVTITSLTGRNGILNNAIKAKQETEYRSVEEKVQLAIVGSHDRTGNMNASDFETEVNQMGGTSKINGTEAIVEVDGYSFWVDLVTGEMQQIQTGPIEQPENTPQYWEATGRIDSQWYSYVDIATNTTVKVNSPRLKGKMTPIKYVGQEQSGSKWANAMTTDGSMWVWVPRYAYKITEGYHTSTAGKIEVAFLDTNNHFLNSADTGTIETDPSKITYTGNSQDQWLVHPAFTSNAENGGGFGEIAGIWVAKFEASGTDATNLVIKPGLISLRGKSANDFYHMGQEAKYGETENLTSHMMKNSEWGAVAYLTHSKYGRNKEELAINTNSDYYTGGNNDKNIVYTTNKSQSTTNNATGIYDISGGGWEYTASYLNNDDDSLKTYAGNAKGDLYGATEEEQSKSTAFKTVYKMGNSGDQNLNYEINSKIKGDAVYETSNSATTSYGSWNEDYSSFPYPSRAVFTRGGSEHSSTSAGAFYFADSMGTGSGYTSFHTVLAF